MINNISETKFLWQLMQSGAVTHNICSQTSEGDSQVPHIYELT